MRAALRELKFGKITYFISDPVVPSQNTGLVIGHLTSREASGWSDLFTCASVCLGTVDTSLEAPIQPVALDMLEQSGGKDRTGALYLLGGSRSGVYTIVSAYYQAQVVKPRPVRVVLLSPLMKVWPEMKNLKHPSYRTLMQRAEKDPAVLAHLERDGDSLKALERIRDEGLDVKVTIVLGKHHQRDMRDVEPARAFSNVRVIELDTDEHLTFFWLKARIDQPNAIKRALELTARNNWPKLTPPEVTVKAAKTVEQIVLLRRKYGELNKLYADMDRVPAQPA